MHIDVLDDILDADDKDKGNGEEYQLICINAWCNRSTWITRASYSYDLTINKKDKCCAPIGTGKLYNNPLITTNGQILFNSVLRPFRDYFSSYESGQSVGGRKREIPEKKKTPGTPASRSWFVSHVASAGQPGLEPTPDTEDKY